MVCNVVMTIPSVVDSPVVNEPSDDDELTHYVCCDPNRALCGLDVTTAAMSNDENDLMCVVCVELDARESNLCSCEASHRG